MAADETSLSCFLGAILDFLLGLLFKLFTYSFKIALYDRKLGSPTRGSRPLWAYRHVKPDKGPFNPGRGPLGFISPLIFNKRLALQLAKRLLCNNNYLIVKEVFVLYSYYRYVKFVSKVARKIIPKVYKIVKNRAVIIRQKLNRKKRYKKCPSIGYFLHILFLY